MGQSASVPTSFSSPGTVRAVVFLLIALTGMAAFAWMRNVASPDLVPWREDVTAARAQARAKQQPMLLAFTADWCPACQEMKHRVYSRRDVATLMTNPFMPIKVDMSRPSPTGPQTLLADRYQVQYLPTLIMTTFEGQEQRRLSGFHEADEIKTWLTQPLDP